MNRQARFWWRVREWWHAPSMYVMCVKPGTFWDDWAYWHIVWLGRKRHGLLGPCRRLFWRHLKAAIYRGYFRLRWWSRLCCRSAFATRPNWQTDVCDWLEDKARACET